jgi:hypothetical protein
MSEKLNKLSFLAGKLFARTVSEVIPQDKKTETSQTTTQANLDPQDKINKVLALLSSKKVGENVTDLLRNYLTDKYFESDEIVVNREEGLTVELAAELNIKKITHQLNFYYNEKSLQILLTNSIIKATADGIFYNRHDLIIIFNGLCVLRDSDKQPRNLERNHFSEDTIKSFQNGSWIEDIEYLKSHFSVASWKRNQAEKNNRLKPLADKLNLDSLS